MGPAARARGRDHIRGSVSSDIASRDSYPAAELLIECEEVLEDVAGLPVENLHPWPAAEARSGNDFGEAIPVEIGGRHVNTVGEARIVGEETPDLGTGLPVEDLHMGAAARARRCDQVRYAIAGDVTGGNANFAVESWKRVDSRLGVTFRPEQFRRSGSSDRVGLWGQTRCDIVIPTARGI